MSKSTTAILLLGFLTLLAYVTNPSLSDFQAYSSSLKSPSWSPWWPTLFPYERDLVQTDYTDYSLFSVIETTSRHRFSVGVFDKQEKHVYLGVFGTFVPTSHLSQRIQSVIEKNLVGSCPRRCERGICVMGGCLCSPSWSGRTCSRHIPDFISIDDVLSYTAWKANGLSRRVIDSIISYCRQVDGLIVRTMSDFGGDLMTVSMYESIKKSIKGALSTMGLLESIYLIWVSVYLFSGMALPWIHPRVERIWSDFISGPLFSWSYHSNIASLLLNCYVLYMDGPTIYTLLRPSGFLLLILTTSISSFVIEMTSPRFDGERIRRRTIPPRGPLPLLTTTRLLSWLSQECSSLTLSSLHQCLFQYHLLTNPEFLSSLFLRLLSFVAVSSAFWVGTRIHSVSTILMSSLVSTFLILYFFQ